MTDKEKIKEEIEKEMRVLDLTNDFDNGRFSELNHLKLFIDSLLEESGCESNLIAKSENKNFEEIDRYCTLCMDINCFGCQYHDIHFRDVKWLRKPLII